MEELRSAAADAGREPGSFRIVCRGAVRLLDEPLDGDDRRPLWGWLDQIRSDVARYRDAGLDELFFELNFDPTIGSVDADPKASMATALHLLEALAPLGLEHPAGGPGGELVLPFDDGEGPFGHELEHEMLTDELGAQVRGDRLVLGQVALDPLSPGAARSVTAWACPSMERHSTVSSVITTAWGLPARLRAFRARGEQENAKRPSPSSHTPHTGSACGRPSAETVTTQKFRLAPSRSAAHDQGSGSHDGVSTP